MWHGLRGLHRRSDSIINLGAGLTVTPTLPASANDVIDKFGLRLQSTHVAAGAQVDFAHFFAVKNVRASRRYPPLQ